LFNVKEKAKEKVKNKYAQVETVEDNDEEDEYMN